MQKKNIMPKESLPKVLELQREIEKHQREIIKLRHQIKMLKDVYEEEEYQII